MGMNAKHYLKDGTVWNGSYHKMPNGKIMKGSKHGG